MRCDIRKEHKCQLPLFSHLEHGLTAQIFAARVLSLQTPRIDYLILNAGVLKYPNVRLPQPCPAQDYVYRADGIASNRDVRLKMPNCQKLPISDTKWDSSFEDFDYHLRTNTIGPIITAQKLLATRLPIQTIVFMSSDSGSATNFREFEDG